MQSFLCLTLVQNRIRRRQILTRCHQKQHEICVCQREIWCFRVFVESAALTNNISGIIENLNSERINYHMMI